MSARLALLALLALAACSPASSNATSPPAPGGAALPGATDAPAASAAPEIAPPAMPASSATPAASATPAPAPGEPACRGADIDILAILHKRACDVPSPAGRASPSDVAITVIPKSPTVRPGGRVDIDVRFTNRAARDIELHFQRAMMHQYDDGFRVEVRNAAGTRLDEPTGNRGCPMASLRPYWSRVVLVPGGSARATIPWQASRYAWAPVGAAVTIKSEGCPAAPSAPLAPGKYALTVVAPLEIATPDGTSYGMSFTPMAIEVTR